jgi:hypothetical protein
LGADYAISGDLIAGLSATYNFSKSGTLNVSGPGQFSGSAPISESTSFDVGASLGYRFYVFVTLNYEIFGYPQVVSVLGVFFGTFEDSDLAIHAASG